MRGQARAQVQEESARIRRGMASGDHMSMEQAAHKLAGGMGAIGLDALSAAARSLMEALQLALPPDEVRRCHESLDHQARAADALLEHADHLLGPAP